MIHLDRHIKIELNFGRQSVIVSRTEDGEGLVISSPSAPFYVEQPNETVIVFRPSLSMTEIRKEAHNAMLRKSNRVSEESGHQAP